MDVKPRAVSESMDLDYSRYNISMVHNNQLSAGVSNEEVIDHCDHRVCQPSECC